MSKKKGVSAEEKKDRILQIFYEKKEFFQLKDLEKIAPKEKNVIVNSVKDVLQKLVDDGLVDTDKIGTSVYFWAFPSKAKHNRKRQLEELNQTYDQLSKKLKNVTETIDASKAGKEDSDERNKLIESVADLQIEHDELEMKLKQYTSADPKVYKAKQKQTQMIRDAANRWTDNIFSVKSWCKNRFNMDESALNKHFGIPDDLDYIEYIMRFIMRLVEPQVVRWILNTFEPQVARHRIKWKRRLILQF